MTQYILFGFKNFDSSLKTTQNTTSIVLKYPNLYLLAKTLIWQMIMCLLKLKRN
jgi:hypothetical protein